MVSFTTIMSTGAKFAWISVELDLNKPSGSKFRMKQKIWKVEYGHRRESFSDFQEGNNLDAMDENSDPTPEKTGRREIVLNDAHDNRQAKPGPNVAGLGNLKNDNYDHGFVTA
ncbi:hypothetical protein SADUNF_Sadunf09G0052300 [Salix dunnii]|uniref:Uncharacterized protein n=1 Tax=Salix dunnii TaxID=1413687 RepID=A0A835JVC4_9ROSI|nr:hypothetical protein SADUNF_Sadunf09G0052300 [Salix dunnii]